MLGELWRRLASIEPWQWADEWMSCWQAVPRRDNSYYYHDMMTTRDMVTIVWKKLDKKVNVSLHFPGKSTISATLSTALKWY